MISAIRSKVLQGLNGVIRSLVHFILPHANKKIKRAGKGETDELKIHKKTDKGGPIITTKILLGGCEFKPVSLRRFFRS